METPMHAQLQSARIEMQKSVKHNSTCFKILAKKKKNPSESIQFYSAWDLSAHFLMIAFLCLMSKFHQLCGNSIHRFITGMYHT